MQYASLIENRKSVRAFQNRAISREDMEALRSYYEKDCQRLVGEIPTELVILQGEEARDLEGAAGYEQKLPGAPYYLVLLTGKHEKAGMNAGFMMEDLILKLEDMDLSACWITFTDSEKVKKALKLSSPLEIGAIAAFGLGEKRQKKMRLNILSMSCVDVIAQRGYYAPKKDIRELAFVNEIDKIVGLDEKIGFYDDMLWQALYSCTKAPSYLNRQPYAFLLKDQNVILVKMPDPYTDDDSFQLDLGIVLLHFTAIAQQWMGKIRWDLDPKMDLQLPQGAEIAAVYRM